MALVTIQRSPSPSTDNDGAESSEDVSDGRSQLRKRSRTPREKLRRIFSTVRLINKLRPGLSESYFTVKGAALILPHNECTRKTTKKSHGGEMQHHLQAMLHILRPEDTIKIAIRLEDVVSNYHRYMALVSTKGRQDTEECVILGLDCGSAGASVGLVLPVWLGLRMKLGGDGGFSLYTDEHSYLFKPVSVQAMWSAIQSLVKVVNMAETMKYIHDGLTHTWVGYYRSRINHADQARQGQWNIEGIEVFAPSSLAIKSDDDNEVIKMTISQKLKEVMMVVDLDEATSLGLRRAVEEKMGISLTAFKKYFDEEMMRILGQMDEASQILDFLFLGSEWNASNLEEIKSKGIGYILNVTKEIDNFFMGMLQYYNVRVLDVEESDLLKHWDKTYKFICKARSNHSKVLVHCKMGISRSASTVMAFLMKDRRWSVDEAFKFVKSKRSIVRPNDGFMEQLNMYEGILTASNKRDIFRSKSDQNLLDEASSKDEAEPMQGSFLGDSLFHVMSHSDWPMAASGGVAYEEEWIADLQAGRGMTPELMQMGGDLEAAEARSADSMDDAVADDVMVPIPSSASPVSDSAMSSLRLHEDEKASITKELKEKPDSTQVLADGNEEDNGGGSRISASSRNIKPDSSWIRPASLDLGCEVGESSTDDVETTGGCQSAPCTPAPIATQFDSTGVDRNQRQSLSAQSTTPGVKLTIHGATESESTDFPIAIESDNITVETKEVQTGKHNAPSEALSHRCEAKLDFNNASAKPGLPKSFNTTAVSESAIIEKPRSNSTVAMSQKLDNANDSSSKLLCHLDKENASPSQTETSGGGNKPRIEMGVRQYFFREKIPWSPGKVKKMREDINKTGHIHSEAEMTDVLTCGQDDPIAGDDVQKEKPTLLSSGRRMSQSQSCVELGSVAGFTSDTTAGRDQEPVSEGVALYKKEEIPLEPGTVLRTRREIEERHRFLLGESDEDIEARAQRSVSRTSSLKQDRSTPYEGVEKQPRWSEGGAENLSFPPGLQRRSLNDLRWVGSGENECLHKLEALKTCFAKQGSADVPNIHVVTEGTSLGQEPQSPRPRGNLDTDTLALIREIGSALLMSPTSTEGTVEGGETTESESCSNMVKYFVRKIEQQQRPPSLPHSPSGDVSGGSLQAEGKSFSEANSTAQVATDVESSSSLSLENECHLQTRPLTLHDSVCGKSLPLFLSSEEYRFEHAGETKANLQQAAAVQKPSKMEEHCSLSSTYLDNGQTQENILTIVESPVFPPQEEDSPTVKHLVDKFESGQTADIPETTSLLEVEDSKAISQNSSPHKGFALLSDSSPSSPLAQHKSTTSSSPGCHQKPHTTLSSPGCTHEPTTPAKQPSNCNMPDCNIPVELYELPSSSLPGHAASQQQKRTATSQPTPSRSLVRSLGPQPFSKQGLARVASEGRTWRPVRPKSTSDHPGACNTSLHHQRLGSADFAESCHQEGLLGKVELLEGSDVTLRQGGGEEGRKKRRLHGKSLPVPSALRIGEQQSQQQKLKLGQGPFYSSM